MSALSVSRVPGTLLLAALAMSAPAWAVPAAVPLDQPAPCAACHGTIHTEWTESMHSRAHADNDPIFAAMRALRMEKQGAAVADKCNQCHTPRSTAAPDAPAGKAGVSCAACHAVAAVLPEGKGAKALKGAPEGVLYGPHDLAPGASPVHGTGPAPAHMKDGSTLCNACHGSMTNPAGAPTCTTGSEAAESGQSCTSCHMPQVEGPGGAVGGATHASHAFLGPHRAWLQDDPGVLQQGVGMAAVVEDGALVVTLENRSGHSFPSGFPGRTVVVKAVAHDAAGAVVWSLWTDNPMKQAPDAVLNKVYVDEAGKPVLPPFSQKLVRDTRLKPAETRVLRLPAPPPEAASLTVDLLYFLVPGPAAKALGLEGSPEAEPRRIHRAELSLDR